MEGTFAGYNLGLLELLKNHLAPGGVRDISRSSFYLSYPATKAMSPKKVDIFFIFIIILIIIIT